MKFSRYLVAAALIIALSGQVFAGDFKPGVKMKGRLYLHLTGDLSDSPKLERDGFSLERVYLTAIGNITENVSTKATLNVNPGANKYKSMYVKYGYATYKVAGGALKMSVGQQATPWVGFVEKAWQYRAIQKVLPDRAKVLSSADLGLGMSGKLPAQMGEIVVQVINGPGYKNKNGNEENNFQKDIAGRLTVKPMPSSDALQGLAISVGAENQNAEGEDDLAVSGLLHFKHSFLSLGVEVLNVLGKATTDKFGVSGFGDIGLTMVEPLKNLGFLFRYDTCDPDKNSDNDGTNMLIVGPRYKIAKGHTLALIYEKDGYEDASVDPTKFVKAVLIAKF